MAGVAMNTGDFMPDAAVIAGIKSDLQTYEARRAAVQRQIRWRVPLFIGLVLIATLLLALLFNSFADPYEQWFSTPHVFLYIAGIVAAVFAYFSGMKPANDLRQSFRDRLLPVIFGFIEGVSYRRGDKPASFDRLPEGTIGSFNREHFDDTIAGRYDGFPFELYEARLEQKTGKAVSSVFNGIIIAFETMTPFPGVLIATRRTNKVMGFFQGIFGSRMEEVPSGVPALDEDYEFRTDNVEAARPLVTGRLAKALEWLGEGRPEEPARVALNGNEGFLLLPQDRNFFELPDIDQPLDYKAHIEPMIADLASLLATASLVRKAGAGGETGATGRSDQQSKP